MPWRRALPLSAAILAALRAHLEEEAADIVRRACVKTRAFPSMGRWLHPVRPWRFMKLCRKPVLMVLRIRSPRWRCRIMCWPMCGASRRIMCGAHCVWADFIAAHMRSHFERRRRSWTLPVQQYRLQCACGRKSFSQPLECFCFSPNPDSGCGFACLKSFMGSFEISGFFGFPLLVKDGAEFPYEP